jgi:multiple sugar transport system substrate-binding protein
MSVLRRTILTLALASCGTLATDQPARAQTAQPATQTIRVMGYQSTFVQFRAGWEYVQREFERRNPGVQIEDIPTAFDQTLNQITVSVLGNNAPDMVFVNPIWMPQLHAIGALEALEPHVPADELRLFPQRVLEDVTLDGGVRGLVLNAGPIMMVHNRTLLREAGLNPDQPPRTWPELTNAIRRICALPERNGGRVYGIVLRTERQPIAAQWTIPVIWGHGGEVANAQGEVTLTQPPVQAAFEWYREIVRAGCSPEGATVADTRNLFAQGRAGFIFEGPWIRGLVDALSGGRVRVGADADIWVAPMPADPSGRSRQFGNHGTIAMTRQARNKELTARFMRFVVGDRDAVERTFATAGVISTSRMDLLTSGAHGGDPFSQIFVRALDSTTTMPLKHPRWAAATDPIVIALQRVIQGGDAAAELAQAEREARRIMARR